MGRDVHRQQHQYKLHRTQPGWIGRVVSRISDGSYTLQLSSRVDGVSVVLVDVLTTSTCYKIRNVTTPRGSTAAISKTPQTCGSLGGGTVGWVICRDIYVNVVGVYRYLYLLLIFYILIDYTLEWLLTFVMRLLRRSCLWLSCGCMWVSTMIVGVNSRGRRWCL